MADKDTQQDPQPQEPQDVQQVIVQPVVVSSSFTQDAANWFHPSGMLQVTKNQQ